MYHIFFVKSSVEGHLACFFVLAIANKSAVYIVEKCQCEMLEHLLGISPGVV